MNLLGAIGDDLLEMLDRGVTALERIADAVEVLAFEPEEGESEQ